SYSKTIAYAVLLIVSLRGVADTRRLVKATALAGFTLAFVSAFVVHVSKDNGTGTYDANDVGCIVVLTLPLAILVFQTSKGLWRLISLAGLACIGIVIPMTASRGAFVGMIFVGAALLIFLPGVSLMKRVVWLGGVIGIMVAVAPASYWHSMKNIVTDPKSDYNWDAGQGRKQLAERGIGYMLRYPVFGIGIGNFGRAEIDETLSDYAAASLLKHRGYRASAPHNSWVQAGAETGILGLLVWIALVIGSAWGMVKLRKEMPKSWAKSDNPDQRYMYLATLYVPIAILGFTVCATFVSFAWYDQSYVLPAISMGIQKGFAEQMKLMGRRPVAPASAPAKGPMNLNLRMPGRGRWVPQRAPKNA
ncbi:MAG TPA: O-antigen ligase family protein, partial [Gemmatimonadaceae bacterium]|nr:O-antigen ligase family protein [Gemmatimonadaceae bacterium]